MKKRILLVIVCCFLFTINLFAQSKQLGEAAEKLNKNDLAGALSVLTDLIEHYPKFSPGYEFRAYVLSMNRNYQGAIQDLSSAIQLNPKNGSLYTKRAFYKNFLGDFTGMLEDYNLAIQNGAEGAEVFNERAALKRRLNDLDGSEKDYLLAIQIRPHYARANNGYAELLQAKGELDKAIQWMEDFTTKIENDWNYDFPNPGKMKVIGESTKSDPIKTDDGNTQIAIGSQRMISKQNFSSKEEAEKYQGEMEQILNLGVSYTNLARMYVKKENIPKASLNIKKAFSINPNGLGLFDIRGQIRLKQGDYEGAISDLTKAITGMPIVTISYVDRGIAYLMLGKEDKAQQDFDKYLQQYPKAKADVDKRIEEAKKLKEQK